MEQSIPSCTAVQCTRGRARWPRGRATGAGGIWRHPGGGTRTNGQKPPPHLVTPEPIPISPNLHASVSYLQRGHELSGYLTIPLDATRPPISDRAGRPAGTGVGRASEPRVPSSRGASSVGFGAHCVSGKPGDGDGRVVLGSGGSGGAFNCSPLNLYRDL